MKRLQYSFETDMRYSAEIIRHQLLLRCLPLTDVSQKIETCKAELFPGRVPTPQTDGFGNTVMWCSVNEPHDSLHYGSSGVVITQPPGLPAPEPNPALRFAGIRTKPGAAIMRLFADMERGGLKAADALCRAVHGMLRYQPGATDISTTAEQAATLGAGVCQDYAHIFVALARLMGWHARYCMGLTVGEGATHAWAEIYHEGAWYGFDPTRNCRTDERYLRFATGRDAADCPVEQGTFIGAADQEQTVFMHVEEI